MTNETFAILLVAALFGLFVLLLGASLFRSRRAATVFRDTAEGAQPRAKPEEREEPKKPKPVSRREFARRSLLASLGLFTAQFGAASLAFIWPNLRGGFGSVIDLGIGPEEVKNQIQSDGQPYYYGAGRFYLVNYEGQDQEGIYEGIVGEGLMALYQKCVHLGCRVPFCQQSQWFECPCHGSKYNRAGEYRDGPAPRGMDRFPVRVEDGTLRVDTANRILGPSRGVETIGQDRPEGPFCVTIGGE